MIQGVFLDDVARECLSEEVTFEQRCERGEGMRAP